MSGHGRLAALRLLATTLHPGRPAFTGTAGSTAAHAHAAVQILFVTGGRAELSDAHGTRRPAHAAIIPTRVIGALACLAGVAVIMYAPRG
ncbi:hypothetical protein ABZ297_11720 [Nonomuraea sp. NPDC005983]|uniref:hypothetical protein n=1 Tax=Nonomuraea sp. NPDC005983 TaxID=3155595 RepID=UPI0033BA7206